MSPKPIGLSTELQDSFTWSQDLSVREKPFSVELSVMVGPDLDIVGGMLVAERG